MQSAIRIPQSAIARGLLPACVAGMDACWLYIAAWLFSSVVLSAVGRFEVPSPLLLALLEMGGWALTVFLLDRTTASITRVRIIVGGAGILVAGLLTLALNLSDTFNTVTGWFVMLVWTGMLGLVMWLLGGYRASERIQFEAVYSTFRLGLSVIATAVLLASILSRTPINVLWSELGGVGLWFFGLSLSALALANREAVRRETGDTGLRSWGWLLGATVAAVLLLGMLGQAFGGPGLIEQLRTVVLWTIGIVAAVLYAVLYFFAWLLSLINIDTGISGPPPAQPQPKSPSVNPAIEQLRKWQEQNGQLQAFDVPPAFQALFLTLATLLVVGTALYFLLSWLRRTRRDRDPLQNEDREVFGSWSLLMTQLRRWLDRLLARFRPPRPAAAPAVEDDLALLQGHPEWSGTLSVRQIYARLLRLAAQAGYPRAPQQTPSEYLSTLARAVPNLSTELTAITAAYMEARYGPMPASAPAVHNATEAWRRAEPLLVEMRKT
jgi:hypothetical protein